MIGTTAYPWEYRWRFAILIGSQPMLAFTASRLFDVPGDWYSPAFSRELGLLAALLACIGVLLRVWGTSLLSVEVMSSNRPRTDRPMTSGLYGVVRNPLYIGTTLLFAGYGLFFGWFAGLLFGAFHFTRCHRVIRYEEQQLARRWDTMFSDYCRQVPRWVPRIRMILRAGWPVVSMPGLLANALFIGMAMGCIASTVTGDVAILIPFECAGGAVLAAFFVLDASRRRQSSVSTVHAPQIRTVRRSMPNQASLRRPALNSASLDTRPACQTSRAFPFQKE